MKYHFFNQELLPYGIAQIMGYMNVLIKTYARLEDTIDTYLLINNLDREEVMNDNLLCDLIETFEDDAGKFLDLADRIGPDHQPM